MSRLRLLRLTAVCCLTALALLIPGSASAGAPIINRFEAHDLPALFADCQAWGYGNYQIVGEYDVFGSEKVWFDKDGNPVRAQVFLHIEDTITNTGTGQTWRDIGRHTDFYWDFTEFGPERTKRAGVTFLIHGPDGGVILHDSGSFVFNFATGTFEHEGGPHEYYDIMTEAELADLFCTTFA
jgi:hypothetical protein